MLIRTAMMSGTTMVIIVAAAAHAQMSDGNGSREAVHAAMVQINQPADVGIETRAVEEKSEVVETTVSPEGIRSVPMTWTNNAIDYDAREKELEYVSDLVKQEVQAETRRIAMRRTPAKTPSAATVQRSGASANYNLSAPKITNSDCGSAITAAERKYDIPPHMLQAIAITESGRGGKPDPWAMNIKGRAHYASGAQEVVNIVSRHGSGSSIDIGCAQINLRWHGHRFTDWRQLLDPKVNAEYAAFHLTELKREFGGWSKAVSAYHSRTPWRGARYACKVSSNYGRIFGDNRRGCGPDIEILASYLQKRV